MSGTGATIRPGTGPVAYPAPSAVLELLKPITWFPPMWAFACGVVSSGVSIADNPVVALLGIVLAGPLVCAMSQAINDWYDREVDAINEPHRPIPSGRIPGRWGLYIAVIWTGLSLAVASRLGSWVLIATCLGLFLAWACVRLVWMSRTTHDIAQTMDATPLWLPQIGMAVGTAVLLVALLDELVLEWRGQRTLPASAEPLRNE